jgi:anhydro-N-acetylmuramic acid kinase
MTRRFYIGLSTGSSLFGVDAALVRAEGVGAGIALSVENFLHAPFSNDLRELLVRVTTNAAAEMRHLGALHRVLGETYALAARQLLEQSGAAPPDILAIGCPGLSVWHDAEGRYPSTLHLGMMGVLAERSGFTVVSDFSSRDLALGGQGLPTTALVDALLFHHPGEHRVLLHLGSVASVLSLPAQMGPSWHNIRGFQAAPCTMLLDGLMRLLTNGREPFDAGGKHAVQGRCLESLLERWMQNHFFHEPAPKCVPRWEFGPDFLNRAVEQAKRLDGNLHDVLCTMTHFVAQAIVHAVESLLPGGADTSVRHGHSHFHSHSQGSQECPPYLAPTRILLSGRGVRNGFLWHLLEQKLKSLPLEKIDAQGIASEARQAAAHAGLAALMMDGVPLNLPSVTGASGSRILGQLTPGASENWSRCLAWMARRTTPLNFAAA